MLFVHFVCINNDKFFATSNYACSNIQMFKGNIDSDTIKYNTFEVPIIAQWVRINPTRWRDRISMRTELYGCEYCKIESKYLIPNSFEVINSHSIPFKFRKTQHSTVQVWYALTYSGIQFRPHENQLNFASKRQLPMVLCCIPEVRKAIIWLCNSKTIA